jgi:phosphatidylglycerophosphate synthase
VTTSRKSIELRELRYPANLLSLLRLALVPLVLRYTLQQGRERAALLAVSGSMFTDMIDGPIARARGEVSQLGMVLDPLADKLTIDAVALALSLTRRFPWWITVFLIGRDLVILTGAVLVLRKEAAVMPPNTSGKAATVAFTALLLTHLLGARRLRRAALIVALIPYLSSCITYGRALARYLRGTP